MAITRLRSTASFRRAGLRIGSSAVVHAVAIVDNQDSTTPVPACRQGYCPIGSRVSPETNRPVSCRRCLRLSLALLLAAETYIPGDNGALVLPFEPALPTPALFPPEAVA